MRACGGRRRIHTTHFESENSMSLIESTTAWCKAEIFGSYIYLTTGILLLGFTMGLWRIGTTETSKALVVPFLVVALFAIAGSTGLILSNTKRIQDYREQYNADSSAFQQNEIKRIEKVVNGYRSILVTVGVLMIIAVGMCLLFKSPLIQSIALAIMLFSFFSFMLEHFSRARSLAYQKEMMELTGKK